MKPLKRTAAVIYLMACAVVVGVFVASLMDSFAVELRILETAPGFRVLMAACLAVIALQALYVLGLVIASRPEPRAVKSVLAPGIEVTTGALASAARAAAQDTVDEVLVEDVQVRIQRGEGTGAKVRIEAIALTNDGVHEIGRRMQQRVEAALERMLGMSCTQVRVRFLPSKTTTVTREVPVE